MPAPPRRPTLPLTPSRLERIQHLFHEALARPAEQRAEFLRAEAPDDPAMQEEVLALIAADESGRDRFVSPVSPDAFRDVSGADPWIGTRLGAYRVTRRIGAGGMGTVYEAVRDDEEFDRRVAIKLIRRGMDSGLVLRRFHQERQILAGLEHPNIAGLLDGGVTDNGQPFFVLEYVEGRSVSEFCAHRRLSIRDRLRLFLEVCGPVSYAHQNLVVHRDLKPSNILVTDGGVPKLLDFGIAKLLRAEEAEGETMTRAGQPVCTPEYASPEQIRGGTITTSADVYALGVVLYELLTGQRPFRLDDRSLAEMERIVSEQQPTRPSAVVSAATADPTSGNAPARLRRELVGELDSIVLMAIAKEPHRRYSSVEALAEDVRRFLDGRPVVARPSTWAYRAGKFVARNRAGVTAATLVLASLAAGAAATLVQWQRAEAAVVVADARFRDVRTLANSLLFEVHDAIQPLPGATSARALIVARAIDYLDRLYQETGSDPELAREVAEAYLKLGKVQGDPTNANLGDTGSARVSLDRALALANWLNDTRPGDAQAQDLLPRAHEVRGDVEAWAGTAAVGVEYLRQAVGHRRLIAEQHPDSLAAQLGLAISRIKLGDVLGHPGFPNVGDQDGAMAQYRDAIQLLLRLPPDQATEPGTRRHVAMLHERMGRLLETDGNFPAALAELQRSWAIREQLVRDFPGDVAVLRDAGIARERLCSVHLHEGAVDAALAHCEAALAAYERLRAADPEDANARMTHAIGQRWLARVLTARGDPAAALRQIDRSRASLEQLADADRDNVQIRRQVARTHLYASLIHADLARSPGASGARALAHGRQAARLYEQGRGTLLEVDGAGTTSAADRKLLNEASERIR
jgi:eukaryotic-like serine/threonine-protein kinase